MVRRYFGALLLVVLFFSVLADTALAGFGITPPYVRNTSLTRNSVYEQQILMVRSDPNAPLKATIEIDAPEIADWIELVEGDSVALPANETKVPMTVRVTVPDDADFKRYTGVMRIKTGKPDDSVAPGAVSISLGAQVDIDLTVIDKEIKDFRVRKISVDDLSEGHKLAWLYFPGKIRFGMRIENTGNIDVAPSSVSFRIYDARGSVLLEEVKSTNRITKVQPFATENIEAEIPTRLPAGSYLARYTIYNDDDIKQEGEVTLSISPYGSTQSAGYGFGGLSLPHKISVLLPIFTLLALLGLIFYTRRKEQN